MKYNRIALTIVLCVFFMNLVETVELTRKHKKSSKSVSQSAKFIAHFLNGIGIKMNHKSLSKKADKICPQLVKSKLISRVISRIKKIKFGLRRLKKLRIKSSGKKRKMYRKLGKAHLIKLLRDLFKKINRCSLVPVHVTRKIKSILRTVKVILRKKSCRHLKCKQFSFRKLNRVYRYFLATMRKGTALAHKNIARMLASILKKFWKRKRISVKKNKKNKTQLKIKENYSTSLKKETPRGYYRTPSNNYPPQEPYYQYPNTQERPYYYSQDQRGFY